MERVSLNEALLHRDAVLRAFLDASGRLVSIPARHAKRLVVLDHLAQAFEPGERYDEVEVNRRLRRYHDDVAALRRYLVEDAFLDRAAGLYWRIGGTVSESSGDVVAAPDPADVSGGVRAGASTLRTEGAAASSLPEAASSGEGASSGAA